MPKRKATLHYCVRSVALIYSLLKPFHAHCKKISDLPVNRGLSKNQETVAQQAELNAAHYKAFQVVVEVVEKQKINGKGVTPLSSLRLIYVPEIKRHRHLWSSPGSKSAQTVRSLDIGGHGRSLLV